MKPSCSNSNCRGLSKKDISIEATDGRISVKGDRKEPRRNGIVRRSTRVTGSFAYEVALPTPIDTKGVTAAMTDGVLTITAPKAVAARPIRVAIG